MKFPRDAWLSDAAAPVVLLALFGSLAIVCHRYAPATFDARNVLCYASVPAVLVAIALPYSLVRHERLIGEIVLYAALTALLPVVMLPLTYFAIAHGLQLQDQAMTRIDAMLGFDWAQWARFMQQHPGLEKLTTLAYLSSLIQPFVTIAVLAFAAPRRNAELFLATALSVVLTDVIAALVPTIGPAGMHNVQGPIVAALRAGLPPPVPYAAVVSFPSFHTSMAVLFTSAHRGLRWTFLPFLAVNLLLLLAVPYQGDHYLVDIVAGAIVAVVAIRLVRGRNLTVSPAAAAAPPALQ
jgi:hypothetical protein